MILRKSKRRCKNCLKVFEETLNYGFCDKCFDELKNKKIGDKNGSKS